MAERELSITISIKDLTPAVLEKISTALGGVGTASTAMGSAAAPALARVGEASQGSAKHAETFGQKLLGAKDATSLFSDQVKQFAAGFTVVALLDRAVSSIGAFVMGTVSGVSHLSDLSAKTGISTDVLQKLDYVGAQVGVTLDSTATAVNQLQKRLAGGDNSAAEAMKKLGLNSAELLALDPGSMFIAMAKAISDVPDPAERTQMAIALLGRSGAELLPLLTSDIDKLSSGMVTMSQQTVDSLDEADDAMARWGKNATAVFGGLLVQVEKFAGATQIGQIAQTYRDASETLSQFAIKSEDLATVTNRASGSFKLAGIEVKGAWTALAEYDKSVGHTTEQELESARATEAYTKSVRDLSDQFTGKKLAAEVVKVSEAIKEAGGVSKMTAYELQQLGTKAATMQVQGAALTPELKLLAAAHSGLAVTVLDTNAGWEEGAKSIRKYSDRMLEMQARVDAVAQTIPAALSDLFKNTSIDLRQVEIIVPSFSDKLKASIERGIAQAIDAAAASTTVRGALGALASGMADSIGAQFAESNNPLAAGFGHALQLAARQPSFLGALSTFAGSMASTLGGMIGAAFGGPIGQAIGSALGSIVGPLVNKFFGTAGRDAVKEFADSMGGFDALHQRLGKVFDGATAERYWIALTQGVGKNNPAEAKRIIDEITAAIAKQESATATAATATEAASKKEQDAIDAVKQKVLDQINALDQKRQSLMDSIANEAPEEVMGIIEAQTRAQIAQLDEQRKFMEENMGTAGDVISASLQTVARTAQDEQYKVAEIFGQTIVIPYRFEPQNSPNVPGGSSPYASTGGYVTPNGVQYLSVGGVVRDVLPRRVEMVPRGTDTVPTMLTVGEGVITTRGMDAIGLNGLAALNRGNADSALRVLVSMPSMREKLTTVAMALAARVMGSERANDSATVQPSDRALERIDTNSVFGVGATMTRRPSTLGSIAGQAIGEVLSALGVSAPRGVGVVPQRAIDGPVSSRVIDSVPRFSTEAYVRSPTLAMIGDVPGGELVLEPSTVAKWVNTARTDGARDGVGPDIVAAIRAELRGLKEALAGMVVEVNSTTTLDGMVAARSVARHLPAALRMMGVPAL